MTSSATHDDLAAEIARLEAEIDSALSVLPPRKREPIEEIRRKLAAIKERALLVR